MSDVLQDLIKTAKEKIDEELKAASLKLFDLQNACPHFRAAKTANGSTGGWDKDQFWNEFKCPDCGKFWQEDQ